VRYKEVDNFYSPTSLSRHFVVDYQERKVHFGDGQRGINPEVSTNYKIGKKCGIMATNQKWVVPEVSTITKLAKMWYNGDEPEVGCSAHAELAVLDQR